jgi:hypothetical protein
MTDEQLSELYRRAHEPLPVRGDWGTPDVSLRDYFAAHALIGILGARNGFLTDVGTDNAAPWAYQVADAMLVERERSLREAAAAAAEED